MRESLDSGWVFGPASGATAVSLSFAGFDDLLQPDKDTKSKTRRQRMADPIGGYMRLNIMLQTLRLWSINGSKA